MFAPLLLLAQITTIPASFGTLQRPGSVSTDGHEILALCAVAAPVPVSELLARDARLSDSIRRHSDTPVTWDALGCTRAMLFLGGAPSSKGGMLMPDGGDWGQGGINVLLKAGATHPLSPTGLELLAALYLRDPLRSPVREVGKVLSSAMDAGARSRLVLRGCTETAIRTRDVPTLRRCAGRALADGVDSTWHLLRWARERFLARDTVSGTTYFNAAVTAAHDSLALAELNWHLQWFLGTSEMSAWLKAAPEKRVATLRNMLMRRDITDARPQGARLVEHFTRLAFVEDHFGTIPARMLANQLRTGAPAGWDPNDPGAFRDVQRWQNELDDRGVIWMRFGEPMYLRHSSVSFCAAGPGRCRTAADSALNLRTLATEDWEYRFQLDTFPMKFRFQEEWFDGSVGATTLKGGRAFLSRAVRADDNGNWTAHAVRVAADFYRIWDPATGEPIALVPYALALADLLKVGGEGKRVDFSMTLRQWESRTETWRDSTVRRALLIPRKSEGDLVVGVVAAPSSFGTINWSLAVDQAKGRFGQKYDLGLPMDTSGVVTTSDLVLGAASQGLVWQRGEEAIPLAPQGVVHRDADVSLFFQTKVAEAQRDAHVLITIQKAGPPDSTAVPAVSIAFTETIPGGLHAFQRHFDLSQLPVGNYNLVVKITAADGRLLLRRGRGMLIK